MDQELSQKIDRYLNNTATAEERIEIEAWFEASDENVRQFYNNEPAQVEQAAGRTLEILQQRISADTKVTSITRRRIYRFAAAASLLLAASAGVYLSLRPKNTQQLSIEKPVLPGASIAFLKTGNGKVIPLNGANGSLGKLGQAEVFKNGDVLAYHTNGINTAAITYDTLHVPAGGHPYHLRLADGSAILVNTATTLRFPEKMTAHNRGKLELITGEIYAEIEHNPSAPLMVQTPIQLIEDIGTIFDVSSYPDEPAAFTVLVEGSIKVNGKSLSPGEQALNHGSEMAVQSANVGLRTAWVNGLFHFDHTPLKDILREVARCYDMQIVYQGNSGNDTYSGIIGRDASLQRMLAIIGAGDVHYSIEGRKLIILP